MQGFWLFVKVRKQQVRMLQPCQLRVFLALHVARGGSQSVQPSVCRTLTPHV